MSYDTNNVFARILRGEIPCSKVYEDEHVLAFKDIRPQAKVHALVIPKVHYDNLLEATADDVAAVARTAQRVAQAAMQAYAPDGLNLLQTNGAVAMQTVFHLHVHVLPRYVDDGFKVSFDRTMGTDEALDDAAAALRAAL